jgi:GNAT superfamily N-acetyltransferase
VLQIRQIQVPEPGLLAALCDLLQDAVEDGASVGFLLPLPRMAAQRYWNHVLTELGPDLQLWIAELDGELVGTVQLASCRKENGRHRAEAQKLLVDSAYRQQGLGKALMQAVEDYAAQSGLTLLVLDTSRGSVGETVFLRLGWTRAGEIPGYAASPDGALHPTVIFYKKGPSS